MIKTLFLMMSVTAYFSWTFRTAVAESTLSAAQRRAALFREAQKGPAAVPALARVLDDPNPVVRRTATRMLGQIGKPAERPLVRALKDKDFLVRRTALRMLCQIRSTQALQYLQSALKDENPLVRRAAVEYLISITPRTKQIGNLLQIASHDKDNAIRKIALKALWPFHRDKKSIRERADYDHDVQIVKTIPLPKDGWRFELDPKGEGHLKKWFAPDFDDSKWATISIEQAWQKAGYDYIGVAWYRRWIELPPRPDCVAAELHFKGVDECAWVWVNGVYVGDHDLGPSGWNLPFRLDVTDELKWGEKNLIVVRAMNTAHAGGIWRPIFLDILK